MGPNARPESGPSAVSAALVQNALGHRVEAVLWDHRTDRWYFGDFLRHAA